MSRLSVELDSVEVTEAGEQEWVDQCIAKARMAGEFLQSCTPGYYNNEGKTGERSAQGGFYGGGSVEFFALLEAWREDGSMPGLEIR